MLEHCLIECCAATLAGLKSANLFSYRFIAKEKVIEELTAINGKLNEKGVHIEVLAWKEKFVLIYVYRYSMLERELAKEETRKLLSDYGYMDYTVESCLLHLKQRLYQDDCFPHEIGIFLGYPLQDVIGFIDNKGQNCKYCGFWKVYGDEGEAKKRFERLRKCTSVYLRLFAEGRSIIQMTVSA